MPNVIFPNRRSAEHHFYELLFSGTSFFRNIIYPNRRSVERHFAGILMKQNVISPNTK